jgi:hypothetical protein
VSGDSWQETNDRWLATALTLVRLRLDRQMQRVRGGGTADADAEWNAQIAGLMEQLNQFAADAPPAAIELARRLALTTFELETLLLCAAQELDTTIRARCAAAQDDPTRPFATFALAIALSDAPAWDAVAADGALRRWRLIEISQSPADPLTVSPLRADERIVSYVKGVNTLDERLASFAEPLTPLRGEDLPPSHAVIAARILDEWQFNERANARLPVIRFGGGDRASTREVAQVATASIGRTLYRVAATELPATGVDLQGVARLWNRETRLLPLALFVDAVDAPESATHGVPRLLAQLDGVTFLADAPGRTLPLERAVSLIVERPTAAEQRDAWARQLGDRAGDAPSVLSAQFDLSLHDIRQIAARGGDTAHLWDMCRQRTRPALDALAQRIDAKATFVDLVLPSAERHLLHEIAAQVGSRARVYDEWGFRDQMNRGFGISVLFAGESGTGKTMAAEVLANTLSLDLYRIDLSAVVSKYIGETEKNLRQVFDAAEGAGAILFFDEADALFGKRSEVKDAHDRYANIEVSYLLQRMESYRGLAILATNMKSAVDAAFLRRLRFVVNFPFPAAAEREEIWRRALPARVPRDRIDYARLARLDLTGGNIHAIALNAAFVAAERQTPVTMQMLLDASRTELRKTGRPINDGDLRDAGVGVESRSRSAAHG